MKINSIKEMLNYIDFYTMSESGYNSIDDKVLDYLIENDMASDNFISNIQFYENLSENFMRKHQDILDWDKISLYQKLSSEFILEFQDKLNLENLQKNYFVDPESLKILSIKKEKYELTEKEKKILKELRENPYSVDLEAYFEIYNYYPSLSFLEELYEINDKSYGEILDLSFLLSQVNVPEKFLENHIDDLESYAYEIQTYQKLSDNFIKEYLIEKDICNWRIIAQNQPVSLEFVKEFKEQLKNYMSEFRNNNSITWNYEEINDFSI